MSQNLDLSFNLEPSQNLDLSLNLDQTLKKNKTKKKVSSLSVDDTNEINETNKIIQDITMEYLLNGSLNKVDHPFHPTSYRDKKFYRKRIIQLTKDLLSDEIDCVFYHDDIYRAFDKFIHTSIDYFKTIDRSDILQEDYKDLEENLNHLDDFLEPSDISIENANKGMMRQIYIKNSTLDGLVKRTILKKEEPILPKKKKINLKDPELKNKGIGKKNNLTNN